MQSRQSPAVTDNFLSFLTPAGKPMALRLLAQVDPRAALAGSHLFKFLFHCHTF